MNVSAQIEQGIEVVDLAKLYPGGKSALDGISFSVANGEIFGLLGPNGSGKTTTVKILATLLRKTSGMAKVGGFEVGSQADRVRELIGYAGQSVGVDDDLTSLENLAITGFLHGLRHDESWRRAAELVDDFSLSEVQNVRARRLSGGLRRRLDLAQALVHKPKVLFLDEPTVGLDPQMRNSLWTQLRQLSEEGMTIFLTTQYLEEADRACDRVAILDAGNLVKIGTPAALKEEVGGGRFTLIMKDEMAAKKAARILASSPEVIRIQDREAGQPLIVYVNDVLGGVTPVVRRLQEQEIEILSLEQAQASLDDVFIRYTGDRPRAEARMTGAVSSLFAAAHGKRRQA